MTHSYMVTQYKNTLRVIYDQTSYCECLVIAL